MWSLKIQPAVGQESYVMAWLISLNHLDLRCTFLSQQHSRMDKHLSRPVVIWWMYALLKGYHLLEVLNLSSSNLLGGTVGAILGDFGTIFFAWAVNGNLDCDLTTLDLLAVHLVHCLLLLLLGSQGDEAEATSLTCFAASLELLDHEARDGTEGNLGRGRLVGSEEFFELEDVSRNSSQHRCMTDLLLSEIVWQISDHDLRGGRDAIFRRATLLRSTWSTSLSFTISSGSSLLVGCVGDVGQRKWGLSNIAGELALSATGSTSAATSATASATTTSTRGRSLLAFCAFGGSDGLLGRVVWLASKLDRDLALKDVVARKVGDGLLGFVR